MGKWLAQNKGLVIAIAVLLVLAAAAGAWALVKTGRGADVATESRQEADSEAGLSAESTPTTGQPDGADGEVSIEDEPLEPGPSKPLDDGDKLEEIANPPAETIAMIEPKTATENSKYAVTFQPYGTGPGGAEGEGFIVYVAKSEPKGDPAKPFEFNKENVLVVLSAKDAKVVKEGGTYTGTLVLKSSEGLLVPFIEGVKAVK